MAFAKDEDMIQTLAPDRADKPLGEGILPWAVRRGQHFPDPRALHSVPKRVTIDAVAIAEEIGGSGVVGERLNELLGGLFETITLIRSLNPRTPGVPVKKSIRLSRLNFPHHPHY